MIIRRPCMIRVLFLCVHNSARSQMAEAYCRRFGHGQVAAESAGLEPGDLNPYVVRALQEDGIDISGKPTQGVFELFKAGRSYDHVVTVCSREAAERCPIFPGPCQRHHWPFDDPSTFTGSEEEILARVRLVRDEIKAKIGEFTAELFAGKPLDR
jgi:arsenate reductase (thioredoxin)